MIDGGLLAQGNAGDKTRYMFGFRRSTIDLVLPSLIPASVDLSLTTVPSYYDEQFRIDHELNSAVAPDAVERRHDRYVRALRDEGHRREDEAVLQPHRVRRGSPRRAKYHDGRGPRTSRSRACCPQFIFEIGEFQKIDVDPADGHAARRGHPHRQARRSASRTSSGASAARRRSAARYARHRVAARAARRRDDGRATIRTTRRETFNGTFWHARLRAVDARSRRTSTRGSALTVGAARRRVRAQRRRSRSQPRGELEIKLTPTRDRAALGGRVSPAARVPERERCYTNLDVERSTQTIARPAVRAARRHARPGARRTTPIART